MSVTLSLGCQTGGIVTETEDVPASSLTLPAEQAVPPRRGMVWIPPGALIAGTAPDAVPRAADAEMEGEQVVMRGFYIDVLPFPNEVSAIPLTSVSQADAAARCAEHGKRLCSELEWERACKGPGNQTYEYGLHYQADRCDTGEPPQLRPTGMNVGCRSAFGVRDLHGGIWEWTDSPWGRASTDGRVTLRGGDGEPGEVFGRCAHAAPERPGTRSGAIGFRCCAGERNEAEVAIIVRRAPALVDARAVDGEIARLVYDAAQRARVGPTLAEPVRFERLWAWHPVDNEELRVVGLCAGPRAEADCGALVARVRHGTATVLAWSPSGRLVPNVAIDGDRRDLWVFGGDRAGHLHRRVDYRWGVVTVGPVRRRTTRR